MALLAGRQLARLAWGRALDEAELLELVRTGVDALGDAEQLHAPRRRGEDASGRVRSGVLPGQVGHHQVGRDLRTGQHRRPAAQPEVRRHSEPDARDGVARPRAVLVPQLPVVEALAAAALEALEAQQPFVAEPSDPIGHVPAHLFRAGRVPEHHRPRVLAGVLQVCHVGTLPGSGAEVRDGEGPDEQVRCGALAVDQPAHWWPGVLPLLARSLQDPGVLGLTLRRQGRIDIAVGDVDVLMPVQPCPQQHLGGLGAVAVLVPQQGEASVDGVLASLELLEPRLPSPPRLLAGLVRPPLVA